MQFNCRWYLQKHIAVKHAVPMTLDDGYNNFMVQVADDDKERSEDCVNENTNDT